MRINHGIAGSQDPLITKDGLASVDLATMPIEQINEALGYNDYEVEGPLIDAIKDCPFIEIVGFLDASGKLTEFKTKGEIRSIYSLNDTHVAILDTGKPCVLVDGRWKPMDLIENPEFER